MLVHLRRLLRWSHFCSSSEWSPVDLLLRGEPLFAFFQVWCQVFTGSDPKNQFPGSASSRDARETLSAVSKCVSYIDLFTWIWRICTFSSDLAVTLGFCPIDTLLCPSECMLYEWVTMNSLCIFTWRKKNCPRILKSTLRPSPTVLSCNRVDVTLTSMYTKVLTEWDDTKRSTKCWQRNFAMLAKELCQHHRIPRFQFSLILSDLPSSRKFFSVSLWGVRASHWTCQVSDFHLAPNANTTWSSELRNAAGFRPRLDLGLGSLWGGMFCYWYQHSATPSVTPFNKDFQSLLLYLVFYKDSDMITVFPSLVKIHREWVYQWKIFWSNGEQTGNNMPAQDYHVRVDCAKMICLYRFWFFFFSPFSFSLQYIHAAV